MCFQQREGGRFVGDVTGLEQEPARKRKTDKEGFKQEKDRCRKMRKILCLQNQLAWEMEKCRNYLAAVSLCYCSSGLGGVFEDSPCMSPLDLTLTSHTVVSKGCGDSARSINSSSVLLCTLLWF